jgi:hypothetical protein
MKTDLQLVVTIGERVVEYTERMSVVMSKQYVPQL